MQVQTQAQAQTQIQIQNKLTLLNINSIKDYDWGSKDKTSSVGRLSGIEQNHYAELWIGTHSAGCSKLNQNLTLTEHLQALNKKNLDFLFKILSIQNCLSIQVHPNKSQAIKLHLLDPINYKDDNDKPQMFLTISQQFQAFLGFVDEKQFEQMISLSIFQEQKKFFSTVEVEVQNTNDNTNKQKILIVLEKLLKLNEEQVKDKICLLLQQNNLLKIERFSIIQRLQKQFPDDIGILVSLFLKYQKLPAGSCFGIPAGVPHAYIRGECFELMKNSDNVVRLGLTPKAKDEKNMFEILQQNIQSNIQECKIQIQMNKQSTQYIITRNWRQYKIIEISNDSKYNKNEFEVNEKHKYQKEKRIQGRIELEYQGLGIVFKGSFNIWNSQDLQENYQLKSGQAFYLQKGKFLIKGFGKLLISLNTIEELEL